MEKLLELVVISTVDRDFWNVGPDSRWGTAILLCG
jgi:hypothetical protein